MKWFVDNLVCPRDHSALTDDRGQLECERGHRYPVVDGVPVLLLPDALPAIDIAAASVRAEAQASDPFHLSTLSLSDDERRGITDLARQGAAIDPVVVYLVAATNGLMYRHLIGRLDRYPIPMLPLHEGSGRRLIDVGCSWGRWTFAAAARGYDAVGVDPSLGAVLAARRIAGQLGCDAHFVVGDARHLPFAASSCDAVFSYSVLQHFSIDDAASAVGEMGRVLRPGGLAKVQFPIRFGLRCLYHQARRGFRQPTGFEVRYWTWPQLSRLFGRAIGPSRFEADCYFGIGVQASDEPLMTPALARVLRLSESVKRASRWFPPLRRVADSVFVESLKPCAGSPVS